MPEGLFIRPLDLNNEEDVTFVFDCRRHPEVTKQLFGPPPSSIDVHKQYLNANIPSKIRMYIAKCEAVSVGYCHAYGFAGKEVEIGFVVHPVWQGQGYGGGMVDLLVEEMKKMFPDKLIHLGVKIENERAIRLYERHGFVKKSIRMDLK